MKRSSLTIVLVFFMTALSAQTWAPTGAKWFYNHYTGAQPYKTIIESVGDTTINTKTCKILQALEINLTMDSTATYFWDTLYCIPQYTYMDSEIVYIFDFTKNAFNILYDFNATKGDTITVNDSAFPGYCPEAFPSQLFQYVVDTLYDTIINGIILHKQLVSRTQNSDWLFSDTQAFGTFPTIQYIGSTKYLFGVTLNLVLEGPIRCLYCYQDSVLSYRDPMWPDSLPCGYLPPLSGINTPEIIYGISVFPNPASNSITISCHVNQKMDFKIYNTLGEIIIQGDILNDKNVIDISRLTPGLFILKLTGADGTVFKKFIKE